MKIVLWSLSSLYCHVCRPRCGITILLITISSLFEHAANRDFSICPATPLQSLFLGIKTSFGFLNRKMKCIELGKGARQLFLIHIFKMENLQEARFFKVINWIKNNFYSKFMSFPEETLTEKYARFHLVFSVLFFNLNLISMIILSSSYISKLLYLFIQFENSLHQS